MLIEPSETSSQSMREITLFIPTMKDELPITGTGSTTKGTASPLQPSDGLILVSGFRLEGHWVIPLAIHWVRK